MQLSQLGIPNVDLHFVYITTVGYPGMLTSDDQKAVDSHFRRGSIVQCAVYMSGFEGYHHFS